MLYFAYILGTLKCHMTPGSIKSIDMTNSLFLRMSFKFFLCICKHKRNVRLKYVLAALVFRSVSSYLSSDDYIAYNNVKQKQSSRGVL